MIDVTVNENSASWFWCRSTTLFLREPSVRCLVDGFHLLSKIINRNKYAAIEIDILYYQCQKSATKCPGSITVNPAGNVVRETAHTCSGFCKRELAERPVQAERININRVRSSKKIATRNQSRLEQNPLKERPVPQNGTKPNFVFGKSKAHPCLRHNNDLYNFMYKNKNHYKYYLCEGICLYHHDNHYSSELLVANAEITSRCFPVAINFLIKFFKLPHSLWAKGYSVLSPSNSTQYPSWRNFPSLPSANVSLRLLVIAFTETMKKCCNRIKI